MCANSVTSFGVDWRWIDIIQLFPSLWKSIFFFYFSSLLKALFFLSSQPLYWLIMTEIVLNPTQWERKIPYTEKRKWNIFSFLMIVFIKALVCNERLKQQLFISCTIKHHQFVLLWAPYWCFKCQFVHKRFFLKLSLLLCRESEIQCSLEWRKKN